MKVSVVTIRVPRKPEYDEVAKRWLDTYRKFMPKIPHELIVVDSDHAAIKPSEMDPLIRHHLVYTGGGWDCGTWQFVGSHVDTDLLVCCNTSTYFVRDGWLERIVAEVETYGKGLYGPMTSLAYFPHIRTPCMIFQPEVIRGYPFVVDSRPKTYSFECLGGGNNFTLWCKANGYQVKMVTWDGCYDMADWRKPPNVFWKGDQSNLLVKDRHANRYDTGTPESRVLLTKEADGR